jgi:hypothetical protein
VPNFLVEITQPTENELHIRARRDDGEIREFDFPLGYFKRFNIAQHIISFVTGKEADAIRR